MQQVPGPKFRPRHRVGDVMRVLKGHRPSGRVTTQTVTRDAGVLLDLTNSLTADNRSFEIRNTCRIEPYGAMRNTIRSRIKSADERENDPQENDQISSRSNAINCRK
jgi:hypothetical protein